MIGAISCIITEHGGWPRVRAGLRRAVEGLAARAAYARVDRAGATRSLPAVDLDVLVEAVDLHHRLELRACSAGGDDAHDSLACLHPSDGEDLRQHDDAERRSTQRALAAGASASRVAARQAQVSARRASGIADMSSYRNEQAEPVCEGDERCCSSTKRHPAAVEAAYMTPDVVEQRRAMRERARAQPGERDARHRLGPGAARAELAETVGPDGASRHGPERQHARAREPRRLVAGDVPVEFPAAARTAAVSDGGFDAAVSTQVYEYVADMPARLAEAWRVLRPGGRLLVLDTDWDSIVWRTDGPERMRRVLAAWDEHLADPYLPRRLRPAAARGRLHRRASRACRCSTSATTQQTYSGGLIGFIPAFVRAATGSPRRTRTSGPRALALGEDYFFSLNRYVFVASLSPPRKARACARPLLHASARPPRGDGGVAQRRNSLSRARDLAGAGARAGPDPAGSGDPWSSTWTAAAMRDIDGSAVSFLDCLLYATVSITTTGYGDVVPVSDSARALTTFIVTPLRVLFLG